MGRVTSHLEFLFTDHYGSQLEIFLEFLAGVGEVGHFVYAELECLRMFLGQSHDRFVASRLGGESIGPALMGGRPGNGFARWQEEGGGHPHDALMFDQFLILTQDVVGVLVNVDYGFYGSLAISGFG